LKKNFAEHTVTASGLSFHTDLFSKFQAAMGLTIVALARSP